MAGSSQKSVVAAIAGNFVVTVLKFGAFLASGSGAMMSEAIHSLADTLNQSLLLLGLKRAARPADPTHPYGYGKEQYFWALVSAMGIFVFGCGVTVYHGIHQIMHPEVSRVTWLTWAVLGGAALLEGIVLFVAIQETRKARQARGVSWRVFLSKEGDPTLLAVLFEDAIAIFGVVVAAVGIWLSHALNEPRIDGVASVIIGLLLGALALLLAIRNKELLIGQSAPESINKTIWDTVAADPAVNVVGQVKTHVIASGKLAVDINLDMDAKAVMKKVLPQFKSLNADDKIRTEAEEFGEALVEQLGVEVDRLENDIREKVPGVAFIDIEED